MRVLFVSDYPHLPDTKGGLQTTTHDLCLAIGDAGAEAAVLCGVPSAGTGHAPAGDSSLGYLCLRSASPREALALAVSAWDATAIVVQSGNQLAAMVLAALETGLPTAVYLHNVEFHQLHGHLVPDPSLLFLANSQFTADRWQALCGLRSEVIPPVIRAENYLAGATGDRVLFVNPVPLKGVERLFELAALCPELPFLVVESWNLSPEWRDHGRRRARALGNVEWLAPTDDMRPVYARSRLLLMPSVWEEAFGRTAVEAQLNGLPVLASQRGALPEVVGDGGRLLDAHAPAADWAQALRAMHANPAPWSQAARQRGLGHAAATPLIAGKLLELLALHAGR